MSITFDPGSDRLSPGRHVAKLDEIRQVLVDAFPTSSTRGALYEQWRVLSEAIERFVPIITQWIDGSYVTTKNDPADIDVVSHVDGATIEALAAVDAMLLT